MSDKTTREDLLKVQAPAHVDPETKQPLTLGELLTKIEEAKSGKRL